MSRSPQVTLTSVIQSPFETLVGSEAGACVGLVGLITVENVSLPIAGGRGYLSFLKNNSLIDFKI